jgi:hypothetical protein
MSQGSTNFSVLMASRKTHSVCGVIEGMFAPVTSIEKAKFSLSFSSRMHFAHVSPAPD